jgi:hypothetical protein
MAMSNKSKAELELELVKKQIDFLFFSLPFLLCFLIAWLVVVVAAGLPFDIWLLLSIGAVILWGALPNVVVRK